MPTSIFFSETARRNKAVSRRRFLLRLSASCLGVAVIPAGWQPALGVRHVARIDDQWNRIKRGLPQETINAYRKVAAKLVPRIGALLRTPKWEEEIFKAIANELKRSGVYPDRPPSLDPACGKAEESTGLRGEAADRGGSRSSAAAAGIRAAGATVATVPSLGPIIAAVLVALAAVLMLIRQIIANSSEKSAGRKAEKSPGGKGEDGGDESKEDPFAKLRRLEPRLARTMEGLSDCVLFGRKL